MNPEDELVVCLNKIEATARDARIYLQNRQWNMLNNLLNRIERDAREGSYCVWDIADMA